MTKLMPSYAHTLGERVGYTGRHRNRASWRKEFKKDWMKCKFTAIADPDDPKYATDPNRWVCACPAFIRSRFLICKHLVQLVHPVSPRFFIDVKRRRTTPFWQHEDLRPLSDNLKVIVANGGNINSVYNASEIGLEEEGSSEDLAEADRYFLLSRATYDDSLDHRIAQLQDFVKALEHQRQFRDTRFLHQVERHGAPFFRYIEDLQDLERRTQSQTAPRPRTWEDGGRTMYYRTRPINTAGSTE